MSEGLPDGWVRTTLGDLGVEAQPGFASGKHNSSGTGVLHLRPMNVTRDGAISTEDARFVEDDSDRRVQAGDILFNNTNSPALTGKTALVTLSEPAAYSNHMTRLRPPEGVDAAFLASQLHWLWMAGYFKSVLNNHVNQASVATKQLLLTPVVIPPLAEQRRIVATLDEQLSRHAASTRMLRSIAAKCRSLERSLLDRAVRGQLVKSAGGDSTQSEVAALIEERMNRVPPRRAVPKAPAAAIDGSLPEGWATLSMDALTWSIEYGTSAKAHAGQAESDVAVLRMGNIQNRKVDPSSLKYLPGDHPDVVKLMLEDGDLLFNRTNSAELVGKAAIYEGIPKEATFASYLIRCRFNAGVEPGWVNSVINSSLGRSYLRSVVSQQVGQANINGTKLAAMPIPFPPLEEQRRIIQTLEPALDRCHRLEASVNHGLVHGEQLRAAILAAAYSGRLVPQDPTDEPASALVDRIRSGRTASHARENTRRKRSKLDRQPPATTNPVPVGIQEELPL